MNRPKYFHSTMNGSKTANLLTSAHNYKRQGKNVLMFKPVADTRSESVIKSRAIKEGQSAYGIPMEDDTFVSRMFNEKLKELGSIDIIFIDEVQMLTPSQIEDIARLSMSDQSSKTKFHLYGLLIDYQGNVFESSIKAIENGFRMIELPMTCDFCNNQATHHLLFQNGKVKRSGDVLIVGDDEYKSVCGKCFHDGMLGEFDNK